MIAENNFNRALREAVSSELSDAILHEAKNPHTFSDDFLRKMDKLTKAEQSRFWRMTSTVPKRIAVIMASLLIITLTACSIPSVRAAVVTQFNHPREVTKDAALAVKTLREAGVHLRNQTVLLRGVNDDVAVLGTLLRKLTAIGVDPYYIFQCRPVKGIRKMFQVPLTEAVQIVDRAVL